MKIKDVEIKVVKGDIHRFKTDAVVIPVSGKARIKREGRKYIIPVPIIVRSTRAPDKGLKTQEKKIRDACARALKVASSLRLESIAFPALGCGKEGFPALASAKILSQEAFRYTQGEKRMIKEIDFVLSSDEDFQVFSKTVKSYLGTIIHKLSKGPFVTVDTIIEVDDGIVLIKRSNPPFGWAIPGGFVDYGETLEEAAAREAEEETGLVVKNLKQMHTYSDPVRDPRFHTISTVFICQAKGGPKAASDAMESRIFKFSELKNIELAFDHEKVLKDYLLYRRRFKE